MNDRRNTFGQAYALTVMTPILEGREIGLAHRLDALESGGGSPLARVPGTHFARWVVIGDVVWEGPGQKRDHLELGRLLFTSNFDGQVEPYLEALRTGLGVVADEVWSNCAGYPGAEDAAGFARYLRSHQVESSLFFSAYGDRTVDEVRRNLAVRRSVIGFALATQGMSAADLQTSFRARFGR